MKVALIINVFQDSGQDLALFDSSLPPAFDALSAPSLFQQALSTTLAPVTSTRTTTTSSASNFPAPPFFTPPAGTASDLPASVIFPPPLGSALTASAPAGPSPSHSATAPAFSTGRQHVSLPGVFQPAVSSLSHNLQDLAMLDLGGSDKWVPFNSNVTLLNDVRALSLFQLWKRCSPVFQFC